MDQQTGIYIELKIKPDSGGVYVSSDRVPGLHIMGRCFNDLKPVIEQAIKRLFQDNEQIAVNLIWLSDTRMPVVQQVPDGVIVESTEKLAVIPQLLAA